jgi:O-antigen ligase
MQRKINKKNIRAKSSVYNLFSSVDHRLNMDRRVSFYESTFVIVIFILSTGILSIFPTIFVAGSSLSTYFWLASYLWVGGVLYRNYGIQQFFWFIRYRLLVVVVVMGALASVLWSIDPAQTLQRSVHLIGTTLIGFYIGFHIPPRTTPLFLARALTIIIVGNIFVALAFPNIGQENLQGAQVWKGWHYHKNGLGFTAALAFLFFSIRIFSVDVRNRWAYWILCILSFLVLIKSGSATALIATSAGASIAIYLSLANGLRFSGQITGLLLALHLAIMGALGAIILFAGDIGILTRLVGKSGDLTGRTGLWEMVVALIMKRPWLGFGYGTLWSPKPGTESIIGPLLEHQLGWLPPHAHNGFLNMASQLGLPITVIAVIFTIQSLMEPLRLYLRRPSSSALLVVALLSALIIRTFSEQVLFTDRSLYWIIFIALPILLLRSLPQRIDQLSEKPNGPSPYYRKKRYPKIDNNKHQP